MIGIWKYLQKEKAQETQTEKKLRQKYNEFLSVLFENEYALDLISQLEEKLYSNRLVSFPYVKAMVSNLSKRIANVVESLIRLSDGEHVKLREVYAQLEKDIRCELTGKTDPVYTPIIIPMTAVKKELVDKVGNKMANLGDMHNCCGQLIPDGFTATACAYNHFLEYNNLPQKINSVLSELEPDNSHQLLETEKAIKKLFLEADLPPEIEQSILRESEKLEKKKGHPIYWAVRSSAIGEDLAESSFAGQFSTSLNVRSDQLLQTYKAVASSKYNANVIVYQRMRNIRDDDVAMSVGFLEMIDPVCSGVMYSLNPVQPDNEEIVINAVWGVGELLVEGIVSADVYVLKREHGFPLVYEETADKEVCLMRLEDGGLKHSIISQDKSNRCCLNKDQLRKLAQMALRIEKHFQGPQDIEWCFDQQDQLYLLQARPLRICEKRQHEQRIPSIDAAVIASDTQPISPGVGWGKVFKATSVHELTDLPRGAILVLKHSSPRYIGAFRKVAAVIVEKGNWTDHMASVIREFGVPCLVRVDGIFNTLKDGQSITVDADGGVVYDGIVTALQKEKTTLTKHSATIPRTESHRLLENMAEYIFPLHLTDPRQDNFASEFCRSWHDILRFCHETALNEMFRLKETSKLRSVKNVFKVQTDLPFALYVLDIMGTAIQGSHRNLIPAEQVKSLPFKRLWEGLTDPEVNWKGPQLQIQARDLFSAMVRTPANMTSQPADTKSYALVAPEYLNLSLNIGYHYIVLDCYLTDDAFNNYISLSFKGGAAETQKRNLRVAFVAGVLRHMDFYVSTSGDFLQARLKGESAREFGKKLHTIGHLLGVTRLLDLAMEDEDMVEKCISRFEAHDFSLGIHAKPS
jgi:pyruvate, water dikinase